MEYKQWKFISSMDLLLGLSCMILLIPASYGMLIIGGKGVISSLGAIVAGIFLNITLIGAWIIGMKPEVTSWVGFVSGLFISIIFNILFKLTIVKKQIG